MGHRYWSIYLNDHLALGVAASDLARRMRRSNRDSELGSYLQELIGQLDEDQAALEDLMSRLGTKQNKAKIYAARAAERVGRLKLNGRLVGYSDLSRLVEVEGLCILVLAKRMFWTSASLIDMRLAGGRHPSDLAERAAGQLQQLKHHRGRAAAVALPLPRPAPPAG